MSTPTLALGISAAGTSEVARLAKAVGDLRSNLQGLAQVNPNNALSGLRGMESELRRLRVDLRKGFEEFKTLLSTGAVEAFKSVQVANTQGAAKLQQGIREDATRTQRAINDATEKVLKEQDKAAAKIRVAGRRVDLGGGLTASISGTGLGSAGNVLKTLKEVEALPGAVNAAGEKLSKAALGFKLKLMKGSADTAAALELAQQREQAAALAYKLKLMKGSADIAQGQAEAAMKLEQAKLAWRLKLMKGSADTAAALELAQQREQAAALAYKLKLMKGSADIAQGQAESALKMEQAKLAWRLKLMKGSADTAAALELAQQREQAAALAYKLKLMKGSADIADQMMLDAAKTNLASKTRDAAFAAADMRGQLRTQVRARSQLDAGIAPDVVQSRFGGLATGLAAATDMATLRQSLADLNEKTPKATSLMSKFRGELHDAHSAARGLASGFGAMWLTWGNIAPLLAGAALSHSFVQTLKMGAEVQHTMQVIRVLSEETAESVGGLNNQLLDLARTGPFGPREIAEAMKILSLAGLDAAEVSSSIKDVLNFSVAGTTSIKQAADVMTSVATAFSISAKGYNYVGDVISKTAAISKSSVESIGEAFKTASVVNAQYGASLEDVGVGLALLSNLGIQGTAAGTALRNMYVDILGRTPKVQNALKQLGVDAFDPLTGKARGLIEIFKDLDKGLAKFSPKEQTKLLQNVFSERGGKEAVAVLDALRAKAKDTRSEVGSLLEELKLKIDNAAGFMAVSAANLAITPLNQMKSVLATLQAAMVSSFDALTPYILTTSTRLKEIFNSPEFLNGLQKMVVGIGSLIQIIVANIDKLALVGAAFLGWKLGAVAAGVFTLVGRLAALAQGAYTATAAILGLGAAQATLGASTATAAKATAAKATSLGALATLFGRFLPYLGLGVTAWQMYSFWSDKSAQSNVTVTGSYDALLTELRKEAERLKDINEAKATGISLDDIKARKARMGVESDIMAPVLKSQKALQDLQDKKSKTSPMVATYMVLERDIKKEQLNLARQMELADARRLELQIASNAVATEAQKQKDNAQKSAHDRLKDLKLRQLDLSGGVVEELPEKAAKATRAMADNELSTIQEMISRRLTADRRIFENSVAVLNAEHKAKLVSEGAFQAQSLVLARAYEAKELAIVEETTREYARSYAERQEALRKTKNPDQALKNLENRKEVFDADMANKAERIRSDANKRAKLANIELDGSIKELTLSNEDYWRKAEQGVKKETALSVTRAAFAQQSETARASAEAMTKVEESHAGQLETLSRGYEDAKKAVQDYISAAGLQAFFDEEVGEGLGRLNKQVDAYSKALEFARKRLNELKVAAADGAVIEVSNREAERTREAYENRSKDIAKSLATAIMNGGKNGLGNLKDLIKTYFIKEPIQIVLEAVLKPVGNLIAGVGQSVVGSITKGFLGDSAMGFASKGTGFGNALGSELANGTLMGNISAGASGFGGSFASTVGGGFATDAMGATVIQGASGATLGAGSSIGSMLGPGWGWAAAAAMLLAGSGAFAGETRSGGQYGYGTTNSGYYGTTTQKISGPSGGDLGDAAGAANLTISGINTLLSDIGSVRRVAGFEAGLESSDKGRGGVYAGGTLTGGVRFGEAGLFNPDGSRNSNYDGTLYERTSTNSPGKDEALANFATDLQQVTLQALQAAAGLLPETMTRTVGTGTFNWRQQGADGGEAVEVMKTEIVQLLDEAARQAAEEASGVPKVIRDVLRGVDTEALSSEESAAMLKRVSDLVDAVRGFRLAVDSLPMPKLKSLSFDLASSLVSLAGGLETFQANLKGYYNEFYTAEEKQANLRGNLTQEFAKYGAKLPATRAEFRRLVEAQDLTTTAGQENYTALMRVAASFAELTAEAESANSSLSRQQTLLEAVEEARTELNNAYSAEVERLRGVQERFKGFADSLKKFLQTLISGPQAMLSPEAAYLAKQSEFRRVSSLAQSGDEDALANLQAVSEEYLSASKEYFASSTPYFTDLAEVKAAVQASQTSSQNIADSATRQIAALNEQLKQLISIDAGTKTVADALKQLLALSGAAGVSPNRPLTPIEAAGRTTAATADELARFGSIIQNSPQNAADYARSLGFSNSQIAEYVAAQPQYKTSQADALAWLNANPVQNRASGGFTPPGLTWVGETGPELVSFNRPGQVYSAVQSQSMVGMTGVVSSIMDTHKVLMDVLAAQQAMIRQNGAAYTAMIEALQRIDEKAARTANSATLSDQDR